MRRNVRRINLAAIATKNFVELILSYIVGYFSYLSFLDVLKSTAAIIISRAPKNRKNKKIVFVPTSDLIMPPN